MRRIVSAVALLLALAVVGTAAGQNLLLNPAFNSDLSGWNIYASLDYAATWTGAMGANAPGAAQIDVNATVKQNTLVLQQCVAVSPSTNYDFGADVRFPSGVAQVPYAKVTVQSGSGVFAFASVVDGVTNDPTTVAMQR